MKPVKQYPRSNMTQVSAEELKLDLEDFKKKAMELGATDAQLIPASYITIDERVWMKCLIPRCRGLSNGGSPYCPPNTPPPEFMRKVLDRYSWAILFKREINNLQDYVPVSEAQMAEMQKRHDVSEGYHKKTFDITGGLESYIQSKGYYLALGLSGGSCRLQLCRGAKCGVLENGTCRFPLQSRPSLEAVSIDVFQLAGKVGWDTHMIRRIEPNRDNIPCGVSIGMVLVC